MRAIKPFVRDPFAQFAEARGSKPGAQDPLAGAPAFNFLTGEGDFTQVFTNGLIGLRWRADRVHLDPMLPPQLERGVTLKGLHWQGRTFDVSVGPDNTRGLGDRGPAAPGRVATGDAAGLRWQLADPQDTPPRPGAHR
jgi:cellobiose phosphorylase